jgi:hypothetical protein
MTKFIKIFRDIWIKILALLPEILLKENIIFIGIIFISIVFLRKLLRGIIIKPLFPEFVTWEMVLFFGFLCLCSLLRIILVIYLNWIKTDPVNEGYTLNKSIFIYYQKVYETLGDYSDNLLDKYSKRFSKVCLHHLARFLHENRFKLNDLIFLTIVLPRLIISFAFLLDVFYFAHFYYFYASLYLIFVPLSTRILHYHLELLHLFVSDTYKDILVMEPVLPDSEYYDHHPFYFHHNFVYSWTPSMAENYSHDDLLYYVSNVYWPVAYLDATLQTWSYFKANLLVPTLIFTYSIYSLGWGYLFWTTLLIKLAEI